MSDDREIDHIAKRHGVSSAAAIEALEALRASGGTCAQFDHPELGGRGQWMPGMVQIGAMFDDVLKARVASLCSELARVARRVPIDLPVAGRDRMKPMQPMKPMRPMEPMTPPVAWWPAHYGTPNAAGGQNDIRYAWFAQERRLLVDVAGYVATYDSGDHVITGIAQAQGDVAHLRFTSQHGIVSLDTLRAV